MSNKVVISSILTSFSLFAGLHFCLNKPATNQVEPAEERSINLSAPQVAAHQPKEEVKVIMNDPSIKKNWGLMGTGGQSDIQANKAWDISTGDGEKIVAVIDTGVDVNHPDLAENIWTNPGESGLTKEGEDLAHNGKDNDSNGFKNDVHGWDFVNESPNVVDNHGHGTHIAGIIGAVGGNKVGISGVCPKVKIMPLKYFDPQARGGDNLKNTVRAIRYAIKMGAHVINYSGGGLEPNDEEFKAIKEARDHGIIFIAAAGNEHSNSDFAHYYPANYNLDNIISVTAIDAYANILKTSNFGIKSVGIAAPGGDIYSTLPGNRYGTMTGTSQATAFVSGVAALVMSHNKDFNYKQVKQQILNTADELPGLRDKTATSGKLNSYAALAIQPEIPLTGISAATTPTPTRITPSTEVETKTTSLQALLKHLNKNDRNSASSEAQN